jgi:hypothetical protein
MPIIIPVGTGTSVGTGVSTYSGLLSSVGNWLNRDDLVTKIPDFITLLEARLNRILRTLGMETSTTLTTDAEAIDLPEDCRKVRSAYLDTDPKQELHAVSLGTLRTQYGAQTAGKPEVYAVSGSQLILGPEPDDEYDLQLTYYREIPPLTEDNTTNWLILDHPDVYLYGALVMAEAFLWNDERVPMWKSAWDEALDEMIREGNSARHAGPLRMRPSVSE